ncbi:hypothetical protein C1752_02228 [Acaryochloris thomasi RCC1774]|uniref:DUF4350 domain-containing protein n=1 Tax=Acaryochloris thomasi RCC1774 TaxID=1764569 RepID=A0A2W1JI67_9CYAN|nr:DUF4350 domain-containing protein [Acaryochloris thomasi]PZD73199.1 hypothetical protein C1752_02228 [Acaryochloris thomasi RCC1774]
MVNTSPGVQSADPSRRRRPPVWIVAILLAVLVLFGLILLAAPGAQKGSSYSRALTGYRGWYDYMEQQQQPVKRWRKSYDQLSGTGQTLIQVGGQSAFGIDVSASSREEGIQTWLANGNTLIKLQQQGSVTEAPFTSRLKAGTDQVKIETTRRYTNQGTSSGSSRADASDDVAVELQDRFGSVVWSQPVGKGMLISCAYPWLASNALADQADNYRFLATLSQRQGGTIWIDEWIHGYRDPSPEAKAAASKPQDFVEYLMRTPVAIMAAQLGFVLLLLIWGHNHRFGNLVKLKPERQDTSEQYIQALASTMNAARQTKFATQALGQQFRRTLATQLGLISPYSHNLPDAERLSDHWAEATGRSAPELLKLLEPNVRSDRELLAWVANVESLLRELP